MIWDSSQPETAVKATAIKPDNLSSIPGVHVVEGPLLQVVYDLHV